MLLRMFFFCRSRKEHRHTYKIVLHGVLVKLLLFIDSTEVMLQCKIYCNTFVLTYHPRNIHFS